MAETAAKAIPGTSRPKRIPRAFVHGGTGQLAVKIDGRFHYFGAADKPESQRAADGFLARYLAAGRVVPAVVSAPGAVTVADVAAKGLEHSEKRVHNDSTMRTIHDVADLLVTMFGAEPVMRIEDRDGMRERVPNFGPVKLGELQQSLVKRGLSRKEINRRVGIVRRLFKIAMAAELVPASVLAGLATLPPLRLGETDAPEAPGVHEVSPKHVAIVLRNLQSPTHKAMVRLQWLTGMRSGEMLAMKSGEISRKRKPWVYRPGTHKGTWRGQDREIVFGPKAERILAPLLFGLKPGDYVFSPARERERVRIEKRAKRESKVPPSQRDRRKPVDQLEIEPPGDCYDTPAYAHIIRRVCDKAGITVWRPYSLRHAAAKRVRARYGLEGAAAALGHKDLETTAQHYAQGNRALADKVAKEIG